MQGFAQSTVPLIRVHTDAAALAPSNVTASRSFDDHFVGLFTAEFPRIFRILQRTCGDSDLASDLVQDAFVRLYKRGSMPDVPSAWLVTVALNLFRNTRGTQRRRQRLLTIERGERAHSDPEPAPDRGLMAQATTHEVRAALDQISERDRHMLLMRAEGYSYREIAITLDVHEGSVGTLLARAVQSFRKHYHDAAETP